MAYHTATYSFDVVKTRMQIQSGPTPTYKGMIDCFRVLYRQGPSSLSTNTSCRTHVSTTSIAALTRARARE
jgi:hypothetical protein